MTVCVVGHGFMMHLARILKCLAMDHGLAVLVSILSGHGSWFNCTGIKVYC